MSRETLQQLRVLHIVSAGGAEGAIQQALFMPLLTRMPKSRVQSEIVCLSPGATPAAVLRQNGVPVHDAPLSRKRFSWRALSEILRAARELRPDVIHAWGHTAQIAAALLKPMFAGKPRLVWSLTETAPLGRSAGFVDKRKLWLATKLAARADRIVYTSEAGASQHHRAGFPEENYDCIPPGVDAVRFKPDPAARARLRERLELGADAFVIGMLAPFQPEYDHATLLKAAAELIKVKPNLALVLAGHGVQKGNAQLMALIGGGALSTRTHLLGEWSDAASLFNACDVVCSSATTDRARMTLAMAMLCGVPCVATGMGAQGELLGRFGVAVEPGSPSAFVKGVTRVMQLTPERRQYMVQGARKRALNDYVYVRTLQKHLKLYCDLLGRELPAAELAQAPAAEVDATPPIAQPVAQAAPDKPSTQPAAIEAAAPISPAAEREQRADVPDSARAEQEQSSVSGDAPQTRPTHSDDVLEWFESTIEAQQPSTTPVPEPEMELGDLIAPEALTVEAPASPRTLAVQSKPTVRAVSAEPAHLDAAARMRAAAREELKRAAAAMSAAQAAQANARATAGNQLELLPDDDLKQASG